jgi:hypothetical protein
VKFPTSAQANGQAEVVAQLYTEDGQAYGDPVKFDVRVTEFTATVMLVIGGGFLLLVLAGFRMYTQRKRAAAREAEENGPDTAEETDKTAKTEDDGTENPHTPVDSLRQESSTGTRADAPEQPSDPTPDTAAENADPSGTGERVDR